MKTKPEMRKIVDRWEKKPTEAHDLAVITRAIDILQLNFNILAMFTMILVSRPGMLKLAALVGIACLVYLTFHVTSLIKVRDCLLAQKVFDIENLNLEQLKASEPPPAN